MSLISNEQGLLNAMQKNAEEAINAITDKVLKTFINDYVLAFVYGNHPSPKKYIRTWEFKNSWEWSQLKKEVSKLSTEMFFNSDKMKTIQNKYQPYTHGSPYWKTDDVRTIMDEILDRTSPTNIWFSIARSEAYWSKFVMDMFDNGQLEKIITEEFEKRGFSKI